MKLKSFVLEKWLKDRTQDVYCRSGIPIEMLKYFDLPESEFVKTRAVFVGVIKDMATLTFWDKNGRANNHGETYHDLMLIDDDKYET